LYKNYRGISLLSTASKVRLIKDMIEKDAKIIIGEYQANFRPRRSMTDQLFTMRSLTKKYSQFWALNIQKECSNLDVKHLKKTVNLYDFSPSTGWGKITQLKVNV